MIIPDQPSDAPLLSYDDRIAIAERERAEARRKWIASRHTPRSREWRAFSAQTHDALRAEMTR